MRSSEADVFRNLLLWLFDHHKKPWEVQDNGLSRIYGELLSTYASIRSERELEAYLPTVDKVQSGFPARQFLYLNPISGDPTLIPVLWITADFGRWMPEVRIRLGLFLKHRDVVKAFGYRFEAPEGLGLHHYYHAQMIHGFDKGQSFAQVNEDSWLSDECPTFPLDANNPVALLLSILISLYGISYVVRDVKPFVPGLEKYLDDMVAPTFGAFEWYFRIDIGVEGKKAEYYSTPHQEAFLKHIKGKYTKCQHTSITKETYEGVHPPKLRLRWSPPHA